MKDTYQKIIVVAVLVIAATCVVVGLLLLQRVERITRVAERTEAKIDIIFEAAAPLGREAIDTGVEALQQVDTEDLGRSATEGLKEIGAAAARRLTECIDAEPDSTSAPDPLQTNSPESP